MGFLTALFVLCIVGVVGDTVVKVAKARGGAGALKAMRGELDEVNQQLLDQSAALADAQAIIAAQAESIQELHERMDFAERIMTQARERGMLERGSEA